MAVQSRLRVTRPQILAFRRRVGALDERMPMGAQSLRRAAWAGLQDSMPRAALLSLHARVEGVEPSTWEHSSLAQLWGPRYHTYVVPKRDFALFSLGRLPDNAKSRLRAERMAERLHAHLDGTRTTDREAAGALGDEWLLAEDEAAIRAGAAVVATARLLPSGDAYFLLDGAERELLVPRADQRRLLWTPRVWPGALLVEGEIRGTWRRAHHTVRIDAWARLSRGTRDAIEAEANALPLPGLDRPIEVVWNA